MTIRLLLTGAGGFLGNYLLERADRFEVTAVYRSWRPNYPHSFQIDLSDLDQTYALVKRLRPQVILHAAANSNLDRCERDPQSAVRDNVTAVEHLAAAAQEIGARFLFISSDMVFDGQKGNYSEKDLPNPLSVYGRTKMQAEQIVAELSDSLIVRTALIYGRSKRGTSFSDWMEARLLHGDKVPLYIDQFRSPIFVGNLADCLLELAASEATGIIHLGGPERISRLQFGEALCRLAGYPKNLLQPISMDDHMMEAPRPRDLSLNVDKARSLLKTPLEGIEMGIKRMLAYPFFQ